MAARPCWTAMDEQGHQPRVIGGLSMGGYVTFALYRLAPERFSAMVLADTRATADNDQQKEGRRKMIVDRPDQGRVGDRRRDAAEAARGHIAAGPSGGGGGRSAAMIEATTGPMRSPARSKR